MAEDISGLQERLGEESYRKLKALGNPQVERFVARFVEHCRPESVFVADDSEEDRLYVRRRAIERGEERELDKPGHTVHFDGYNNEEDHDQGRDRENTRFLLSPDSDLGERVNSIDREEGLREVLGYLEGAMEGQELYVRFYTLGPADSPFTIPACQLTDSAYVTHSEDMLYRAGYEQFRRMDAEEPFLRCVHSSGRLEDGVSADTKRRRIYIDLEEETTYSVNTQYGGNTIGLKKLSLRLAIQRAYGEGWLAEHMLIVGVHGPGERVTYFTGAYPSACGKTSTAMLPGESIVGDDIAYLRKMDGQVRAANVESGIFGIIRDVNSEDDPLIWKTLNEPGETIFSNVLVADDGTPYWLGKDGPVPEHGVNHSGEWWPGKEDELGNPITPSHKNARYTVRLKRLDNCDPAFDDPRGVPVAGIIYGGRDSDTWVPVEEAFDWAHGIITKGASLESETTAATLGAEGVRQFTPMSNLDFLSITIGRYIQANLDFPDGLGSVPRIFSVNYFLKGEDGAYLNDMADKKVWLKWMELRVHREAGAIETPTGLIPRHEDLRELFRQHLDREYPAEDYQEQFVLRVPEHLAKIERIEQIYRDQVPDTPPAVFELLEAQRERLRHAADRYGDYVLPRQLG